MTKSTHKPAEYSCVTLQISPAVIFFYVILISYIFLTLFFTINHVYLEWDEIMFKVVGRKFVGEAGSSLFEGMGIYKAPLFSLLLGFFGQYDFFVIVAAAIVNFILLSTLLSFSLENNKNSYCFWLLGLTLFTFSNQVQYYLVVFYAETLTISFTLCTVFAYVKRMHPFLVAIACFGAFLTKLNLGIFFIFYLFCYLCTKNGRRAILPFISGSIFLLIIYGVLEFSITNKFAGTFLSQLNKVSTTNPWIIESKLLSTIFYPLTLFEVLGIPNGILFYGGSILIILKVIRKNEIPEVVKVSWLLTLFVLFSLTFISTKSDRFIVPILPLIIVINIWALSELTYFFNYITKVYSSSILRRTAFCFISLVLIASALGIFSIFKYNTLLSRAYYSFSEPLSLGSTLERFFWRKNSEKAQLVYQQQIFYRLHSSFKDKAIFTDLWHHYVYANFGHEIISIKTKEMERAKLGIKRINTENVPKGAFFLGRHDFENSILVGKSGDIKGLIVK